MKLLSTAVVTLVIASGSISAQARGVSEGEMEQCRSQISGYYGGAQDMSFVGKRQFHDGAQLKLAVRSEDPSTGYTRTRLATCWLGAENFQAYAGEETDTMVADVERPQTPVVDGMLP